jgi:hypothetical protein
LVYGALGLLGFLAIFYLLSLFDPNTLFNARRGFQAAMNLAFGPDNWRAGEYSYNYQGRTMTVRNIWIARSLGEGDQAGRLLAHVAKLEISHLTWAREIKALLTEPDQAANPQTLASKVVAHETRFFLSRQPWRAQGYLGQLAIQGLSYAPPVAASAGGPNSPPASPWAGWRPEQIELSQLRLSGQSLTWPSSLVLSLPSWRLVNPRWGPQDPRCEPGSLMAGLGLSLSVQRHRLSARLDELAHNGTLGLGRADNLTIRNLAVWVEPGAGEANLSRAQRKNLEPAWLEVAIADGTFKYLDFRPLAQRLLAALGQPGPRATVAGLGDLITAREAFLGGLSLFESRLNQISLKTGGLTSQARLGELSITAGLEPYALSYRLAEGWFSLADPQDPARPFWSELYKLAEDLDLLAGRFHLAGQAGRKPQSASYQLDATLELTDLLGLTLNLGLEGLTPTVEEALGQLSLTDLLTGRDLPDALRDLALSQARAQLRDAGLTERLLAFYWQKGAGPELSPSARKERVIFGLVLALTLTLEKYLDNSRELTDLMARFLRQPGIVTVQATPTPAISPRGFLAAGTLGDLLEAAHLTLAVDAQDPLPFKWKKPWAIEEGPWGEPLDWQERPEKTPDQ